MKLRDFFLLGIKAGMGKKRAWMNSLFYILAQKPTVATIPYQPMFEDDRMYFHMPGREHHGEDRIYIEDYIPGRPPLAFRDEFILEPGELANYQGDKPLRTTYGNVFVNQLVLVEPFGSLIPFQAGYFSPSAIEGKVLALMIDDREDGDVTTPAPDGKLYVWQYLKFCDHCLAIPGYADGLVTPATKKSMTASPDRNRVRAELLEKYKDRLDDPAVVAKISDELIKLDVDYLKDDESFEFYNAKYAKLFGGVRKRVHYLFGGEAPFQDGTTVELISKSLEEGIDMDKLPVMNNSTRFGSYNRGAQTALGGESTKTIYRMVGTVRIIEQDCKTWIGIPTLITEFNVKDLVGYSHIVQGKSEELTSAILQANMGNHLSIRGPMTCKSGADLANGVLGKGKNICAVCAGKELAENPNGIPAAAAGVGGRFLMIFMSKMHSATVKTAHWDMHRRIT